MNDKMANEGLWLAVGLGIGAAIIVGGCAIIYSSRRRPAEREGYLTEFRRNEEGDIVEIVEKPLGGGQREEPATVEAVPQ